MSLGIALTAITASATAAVAADREGNRRAIVPVPPPTGKYLGFNDHSVLHPARDVTARSLARVTQAAGANMYRMSIDWREVEPERDVIDEAAWDRYESIAQAFRRRGQKLLVTLSPAPAWARDPAAQLCFGGIGCSFPPAEAMLGEWAEYVREIVRRIPGVVIESWNEPNLGAFWMPFPQPARWARLHAVTFAAAKSVNRKTEVLAGGFAGTLTFTDRQEVPLRGFLERAYATGLLEGTSDALSIHLYSANQTGMGPHSVIRRSLATMREIRDANGQRRKPIWVTETGLSTSGWWAIEPEEQASGLIRRYRRLMTMPDVDAMIIHTAIDQIERGRAHRAYGFGVVEDDNPLTVKPAFCEFAGRASADPPGGCKPHIEGMAVEHCRKRTRRDRGSRPVATRPRPAAGRSRVAASRPRSARLVRCMRRYVKSHQED